MSRQKTEINPIRAERVKILIRREKISQQQLADRIFQTQQNISRIIQKRIPLTEATAQLIVKAFPEYRLEWILGYDDSMTFDDWIESSRSARDRIADGIWGMIEKSLSKQGKTLRFVHRQNVHVRADQRARADCYYTIVDQDGAVLKTLTAVELIQFEKQLQEYCDFLTERHLLA